MLKYPQPWHVGKGARPLRNYGATTRLAVVSEHDAIQKIFGAARLARGSLEASGTEVEKKDNSKKGEVGSSRVRGGGGSSSSDNGSSDNGSGSCS